MFVDFVRVTLTHRSQYFGFLSMIIPSNDAFVGAELPTGQTLGKAFGANTPIARITISQAAKPSNPIDRSPPLAQFDATDVGSRVDYHEVSVTDSNPCGIDLNSITTETFRSLALC